jgi:hypothetical protein
VAGASSVERFTKKFGAQAVASRKKPAAKTGSGKTAKSA